jgi:hypothetical protein
MVVDINKVSNPAKVRKNFKKYIGNDNAVLKLSEKPDKKYKVIVDGKTVHFGSTMPDFTQTNDKDKQKRYLARATAIKGKWKDDKYSRNNLAINLLWK